MGRCWSLLAGHRLFERRRLGGVGVDWGTLVRVLGTLDAAVAREGTGWHRQKELHEEAVKVPPFFSGAPWVPDTWSAHVGDAWSAPSCGDMRGGCPLAGGSWSSDAAPGTHVLTNTERWGGSDTRAQELP